MMKYVFYTRAESDIREQKPGFGFTYASEGLDNQTLYYRILPLLSCVKTTAYGQRFFAVIPSLDENLTVFNGIGVSDGDRQTPFIHAYILTPEQRKFALTKRDDFLSKSCVENTFLELYAGNMETAQRLISNISIPQNMVKITDFFSFGKEKIDILPESLTSLIVALHYSILGEKKQVFWIQENLVGTNLLDYGKELLALLYCILPIAEVFGLGTLITDTDSLEVSTNVINCKLYYSLPQGIDTLFPGTNFYILNHIPQKVSDDSVLFVNGEAKNFACNSSDFEFIKLIMDALKNKSSLHKRYEKIEKIVATGNIAAPDLQDMEYWEIAMSGDLKELNICIGEMARGELLYLLEILHELILADDEELAELARENFKQIFHSICSNREKFSFIKKSQKAQKTVVRIILLILKISKQKNMGFVQEDVLFRDLISNIIADDVENIQNNRLYKLIKSDEGLTQTFKAYIEQNLKGVLHNGFAF